MTRVHRTGPVGRLARLGWAAIFALSLWSITGPELSARFRNPHILGEPSAWVLHLAMVLVFVILVGAVAGALAGQKARVPSQIGAVIALIAIMATASAIGLRSHGSAWGFPLADVVWWFDAVVLVEQIVATLLAVVLGLPGCEIGVWPWLIARARGDSPRTENVLACVIGLHLIDQWEARRRMKRREL